MEYQGAIKEMEKRNNKTSKRIRRSQVGNKNITERVSYLQ